jgi:hypothetical protein
MHVKEGCTLRVCILFTALAIQPGPTLTLIIDVVNKPIFIRRKSPFHGLEDGNLWLPLAEIFGIY